MTSLDGLLPFLDTRSFASLWYWLVLAVVWSLATRRILGVPPDVVLRARRATHDVTAENNEPPSEALVLLDWLSLTLPRMQMSRTEAAALLGIGCFALTVLLLLGFRYGYELPQALTLMLLPLGLLAVIRLNLARRMAGLIDRARRGEVPASAAAASAARQMVTHRWIATGLSILAVAATAAWGALWGLTHPNGL